MIFLLSSSKDVKWADSEVEFPYNRLSVRWTQFGPRRNFLRIALASLQVHVECLLSARSLVFLL